MKKENYVSFDLTKNYFFEKDLLRRMLIASNKIKIDSSEYEMIVAWKEWLRTHKDFIGLITKLSSEELKTYNEHVSKHFGKPDLSDTSFSFPMGIVIMILKKYLKTLEKPKKGIIDTMIEEENELEMQNRLTPLTFSDFMAKEDKKEYYVKNFIAKGTINMIYSPPACMKSFLSYYLGICLATGNSFLNQKTKKVNVGYFDWENPFSDVQNRVKGICKGMDIDLNTVNSFYFFTKQPTFMRVSNYDSFVVKELREELLEFIELNDIKVLFFDTLRRLGNFDENDSKAINTIKSELFDYLIVKKEVCIIFLHHTSKEGKQYRGSVDIEGILDTAYSVSKKESENQINLVLKNSKRRNNEFEVLKCSVNIENEDYEDDDGEMYEKITNVVFEKVLDEETVNETSEYSDYRNYFIENLEIGQKYKNKDLCQMLSYNFGISSTRTQNKIVKWLNGIGIIKSFGENKSKYYILNPSHGTNEDSVHLKTLEQHFHKMFSENDKVSVNLLKDKFEEKYFSLLVSSWLEKGWLNNALNGYLIVTDLFKSENNSDESIDVEEVDLK